MEAATIKIPKMVQKMIQESDNKFTFDINVEKNFICIHARFHLLYLIGVIVLAGIITAGVYLV